MEEQKMVNFNIISQPVSIMFDCPYCGEEEVEIPWYRVKVPDNWMDKWEPVECPYCHKTIRLADWEYD